MGLLDRLRGEGDFAELPPAEGFAPEPEAEVRRRLLEIAGPGIKTAEEANEVVVAWQAKVAGRVDRQYRYRAIWVELDEAEHTGAAICMSNAGAVAVGELGQLAVSRQWKRGQFSGSETHKVLAWAESADDPDAPGPFTFDWASLREPVIEAVTGAGWTYRPKRM